MNYALSVYDDRYIKTNANFRSLDVSEDGVECECFTVISIDSILVQENKY